MPWTYSHKYFIYMPPQTIWRPRRNIMRAAAQKEIWEDWNLNFLYYIIRRIISISCATFRLCEKRFRYLCGQGGTCYMSSRWRARKINKSIFDRGLINFRNQLCSFHFLTSGQTKSDTWCRKIRQDFLLKCKKKHWKKAPYMHVNKSTETNWKSSHFRYDNLFSEVCQFGVQFYIHRNRTI